jgi:hypothetical protein
MDRAIGSSGQRVIWNQPRNQKMYQSADEPMSRWTDEPILRPQLARVA